MITLRCIVSQTPIRSAAKESAEMISELLFGEAVLPLELTDNWVKVQCSWDNYVGWVDRKQLAEFPSEQAFRTVTKLEVKAVCKTGKIRLSAGSQFDASGKISLETGIFSLAKTAFAGSRLPNQQKLVAFAQEYLHTPYRWGGRSVWGIDCSGFAQVAFAHIGIALPRDSKDQAKIGTKVMKAADLKAGDLAFFQNEKGKITHVGIMIRKGKIIHCSGQVRVDSLDERGIIKKSSKNSSKNSLRTSRLTSMDIVSHKWAWGIKLSSLLNYG